MTLQYIIVGIIVAAAVVYAVRRLLGRGSHGGCGCESGSADSGCGSCECGDCPLRGGRKRQ